MQAGFRHSGPVVPVHGPLISPLIGDNDHHTHQHPNQHAHEGECGRDQGPLALLLEHNRDHLHRQVQEAVGVGGVESQTGDNGLGGQHAQGPAEILGQGSLEAPLFVFLGMPVSTVLRLLARLLRDALQEHGVVGLRQADEAQQGNTKDNDRQDVLRPAPVEPAIHHQRGSHDRTHGQAAADTEGHEGIGRATHLGSIEVAQGSGHIADWCRRKDAAEETRHEDAGGAGARGRPDAEHTVQEDGGQHAHAASVGFADGRPEHGTNRPSWKWLPTGLRI